MPMKPTHVWGALWLLLLGLGCSRNEPSPAANTQALGSATQPQSTAPSAAAAANNGLDSCLVGSWKSVQVVLNLSTVQASGGGGVAMKIEPTGASVIDFTPMAPIDATANNSLKFDFRYSGKATGNLKTPSPGVVGVSQSDYSGLKVSAAVKIPGGATVALFKDTPVASLATLAGSLAAGAKGQPAPAAATQGIEASPVFSTDTYTCAGSTLTLSSAVAHSQWTFTRVAG